MSLIAKTNRNSVKISTASVTTGTVAESLHSVDGIIEYAFDIIHRPVIRTRRSISAVEILLTVKHVYFFDTLPLRYNSSSPSVFREEPGISYIAISQTDKFLIYIIVANLLPDMEPVQIALIERPLESKEIIFPAADTAAEVQASEAVLTSPEGYFIEKEVGRCKVVVFMQTTGQMIVKVAVAHQNNRCRYDLIIFNGVEYLCIMTKVIQN